MPLDGLRAWIGEVERKLGMRTRVFLVLATIAIGAAGAAIYLAIDTREDAVSESDVRELQQRLEGQGAGGASATDPRVTQLEAELQAVEAEVNRLTGDGKGEAGDGGPQGSSDGGAGSGTESGAGNDEASTGATPGAGGADLGSGASGADQAKLRDLLEEAKKQNAEAEAAE